MFPEIIVPTFANSITNINGWNYEYSVINYSPLCRSIRPSFIFGTQIKIFLMKSKSFLTLHRRQHTWNVPRNIFNSPCDIRHSTVILWSYENTFVRKENKNNDFIQQFFSSSRLQRRATIVERVSRCIHGLPLRVNNKFILINILICVPEMNEGLTGLERHEGE